MKLTNIQKTMLVFLQNQKAYTAWDFRKGQPIRLEDGMELFTYDYLPRTIHELEKIKLPSGKYITFDKTILRTQTNARYKRYSLNVKSYSVEDVLFMSDMKNIKKVNKLETKTSNWLDKLTKWF